VATGYVYLRAGLHHTRAHPRREKTA